MELRNYQQELVLSTAKGFSEFDRQLAILPTGGGKTICFAALAARFWRKRQERTLVLVHREQLMTQAVDKIHKATGIVAQVEMGSYRASQQAEVVVGSVQTLQKKRLERWPQDHFGLLVTDEAHHALATSWQNTLAHFHGRAKVLGVTATPGRSDKKNLGEYFQNIAYEISLLELIRRGYLAPVTIQTVPLKIDLTGVKQSSGDFDATQAAEALEPVLRAVVEEIKRCAGTRKTIVFLPLIRTSKRFAELCREAGLTADHVDGEMDDNGRVLAAFTRGEFQVLCNAMLLTEGYDEAAIECVVNLRPTKSTELYAQIVGRGTRLSPETGKKNLLVLDFLWQHEKHNLARPASLIAKDEKIADAMTQASQESGEQIDLMALEEKAAADIERKMVEELAKKQRRKAKTVSLEEVAALLHQPDLMQTDPALIGDEPLSDWQKAQLETFKVDPDTVETSAKADELIDRLIIRRRMNLATVRQVVFLEKMGHPNPHAATFDEAKAFLDARWGNAQPVAA